MSLKDTLYGWDGANESLFRDINSIDGGRLYESVMRGISHVADHHNFPYYLIAFIGWALVNYLIRKTRAKGGAPQYLAIWTGVIFVFCAGYAVDGAVVKLIKTHMAYPRPYIAIDHVHMLMPPKDAEDGHQSFPSGHASFATLVVISLWPVLAPGMGFIGVLIIAIVCWARIAAGMHFPADVLGGVLITLTVVLIVRFVVYAVMHRLFGLRC